MLINNLPAEGLEIEAEVKHEIKAEAKNHPLKDLAEAKKPPTEGLKIKAEAEYETETETKKPPAEGLKIEAEAEHETEAEAKNSTIETPTKPKLKLKNHPLKDQKS